jgi:hypothetical protein
MNHDDDPKLILDDNEWRSYKRATRNLRYKQRMEHVRNSPDKRVPMAWLQAVDWDDAGDPVLVTAETFTALPVELVA